MDLLPEFKGLLPSHMFSFDIWESASFLAFDLDSYVNLKSLKKYVLGYIKSEDLEFRPRYDEIAVMWFYRDNEFWFHVSLNDFDEIMGVI